MAIIDNLKKISDIVWELPATYKEGMRVPARIIAKAISTTRHHLSRNRRRYYSGPNGP